MSMHHKDISKFNSELHWSPILHSFCFIQNAKMTFNTLCAYCTSINILDIKCRTHFLVLVHVFTYFNVVL